MALLIAGLIIFLGVHSVRIVADDWRTAQLARAPKAWKGIYTIFSLIGLVLIVYGYGLARQAPVVMYHRRCGCGTGHRADVPASF